jgi:hypothetical protein
MPYKFFGGPLDGQTSMKLASDYTPVPPAKKFASFLPHPTIPQQAVWNRRTIRKARYWHGSEQLEVELDRPLLQIAVRGRDGEVEREQKTYNQTVRSILPFQVTLEGTGPWHPIQQVSELEIVEWEDPE